MAWKVPLFELNYDEREKKAVADVLASGWITMGECTQTFERQFAEFLGHGALTTAVSNGTAALHMAVLALGIGPGDEVIVPALTFIADVNVVRLAGAAPVTADCVSFDDWNIDPADVARKITPRTKAVMIVHYAGYPCNMEILVALCRERGLYLIEDCAHTPGATYRGQSCGTFGDVACFLIRDRAPIFTVILWRCLMNAGRILVVDDEDSTRFTLTDYFTNVGYEVDEANNGEEVLKKFAPGKFDCVISDLFMPIIDGMELLKRIRSQDSNVSFLMITGYPRLDSAIGAMKEEMGGQSPYYALPS